MQGTASPSTSITPRDIEPIAHRIATVSPRIPSQQARDSYTRGDNCAPATGNALTGNKDDTLQIR